MQTHGIRGGTKKITKKLYMPTLLLIVVDVQDLYVDKINPNFTKKIYPQVPRWVPQRRILSILFVIGLVTHIDGLLIHTQHLKCSLHYA